jgi:hypothetical protein
MDVDFDLGARISSAVVRCFAFYSRSQIFPQASV